MKRKIMYVFALVCCLNFFSSIKQTCMGSVKEYSLKKPVCVKKVQATIKTVASKGQRPFHFYLFNI